MPKIRPDRPWERRERELRFSFFFLPRARRRSPFAAVPPPEASPPPSKPATRTSCRRRSLRSLLLGFLTGGNEVNPKPNFPIFGFGGLEEERGSLLRRGRPEKTPGDRLHPRLGTGHPNFRKNARTENPSFSNPFLKCLMMALREGGG